MAQNLNPHSHAGRIPTRTLIILAILAIIAVPAIGVLRGCNPATDANIQHVKLASKSYFLEIASDDPTRMKGLGGREKIPDDGGMLFVFPDSFPRAFPSGSAFVMRDCPSDIDIIYLDPNGRITAMHEMKKEAPRGPDEGQPGDMTNLKYEGRLKKYPSNYAIQFAIEIAPGSLSGPLKGKIKEGDKVDLPLAALKSRAK